MTATKTKAPARTRKAPEKKAVTAEEAPKKRKISLLALEKLREVVESTVPKLIRHKLKAYEAPPGVVPASAKADKDYGIAMDRAANLFSFANNHFCYTGFPGYPYLSELAQVSEYRSPVETTATEMTRKWIRLVAKGDDDKSEKIKVIEAALKKYKVRDVFRTAAEHDGFFGIGQIYIDIKGVKEKDKKTPLARDAKGGLKGKLNGFRTIEPVWAAAYKYDSLDPTSKYFYKPESWFVMGVEVHSSRFLTLVSREVPDILKPAYNFGGISMTQLMEPYVRSWLRTRNAVSELLHTFSTSGIKTDMSTILSGESGDDVFNRADLYNNFRDNRGLMLLDIESGEEFFQFNVPLGGLDKLQAQSQEQMAAPSHTPLVKLTGITPAGLNANSDGEIRVYGDYIHAAQENLFREPLSDVINVIQLDEFGEIDQDIDFEFEPLYQLDELQLATVRKMDAETEQILIADGAVGREEERKRVANEKDSKYSSINAAVLPELPFDPNVRPDDGFTPEAAEVDRDLPTDGVMATDGQFKESDHPRRDDGKFGTGSAGNKSESDEPQDISELLGPEHKGFKGMAAIAKLMSQKNGHVKGAFSREDIGDIDLIWGNDDIGLQHIIKRRKEQGIDTDKLLSELSEAIEKGKLRVNNKGNFEIWHNGNMAVVYPEFKNNKITFLVTAFKRRKAPKDLGA